ncbi:MAG: hypothetical protein AB7P14_20280 [Blastocatellales bacterium]
MNDTVNITPDTDRSPDEIIATQIVAKFQEQELIAGKLAAHLFQRLASGQMDQESWQRLAELVDEEESHAQTN